MPAGSAEVTIEECFSMSGPFGGPLEISYIAADTNPLRNDTECPKPHIATVSADGYSWR
jgi:hypothetical protein